MNECIGKDVEDACMSAKDGKLILLENLRFHMEEEGKGVINEQKVKAEKAAVEMFR